MSDEIATPRPVASSLGRVQHVSLCIADVPEARDFYVGILGLTEAYRPELPVAGMWLQVGDVQVHLIVPPDPVELPKARQLDRTPLAPHLAFEVAALEPVVARLRSSGLTVILSEFVEGQAFLTDPSGNIIELNAPAAGPA